MPGPPANRRQAELARAQAAVDRQRLTAPFDGIVDTLEVELGEWVQTGAPVATILSLDPIVVMAEVSELDLGSVDGRVQGPGAAGQRGRA